MIAPVSSVEELKTRLGDALLAVQETQDGIPTAWVRGDRIVEALSFLKQEATTKYPMLIDLTGIDERTRKVRIGQPDSDFTVVYLLLSLDNAQEFRIKVPLKGDYPSVPTCTGVWPMANWYEREVWDMFGINFEGHPFQQRILMPRSWEGHPLRKEHPARATEMGRFRLWDEKEDMLQNDLEFKPEEWGMAREGDDNEFLFLNIGPQHPGTHGVIRFMLQLDGEIVRDSQVDIGYHHRGAEKMSERQSWHSFIPYTDRVDYLGGVMNNLPYVMAVEKLAGIEVPDRVKTIRVMLCELFRISSHLVFYGTYTQDIGQFSPVIYMFNDRERVLSIIEAVCGARMHPNWFRIGGLAADLPKGWDVMVRDLIDYLRPKIDEYEKMCLNNAILKRRTVGVGSYNGQEAIDWGITGASLRAAGVDFDLRKARPYSGYENFEFDVPTADVSDSYTRAVVRAEEIRQSLRIIEQCLNNMPAGSHKSNHPLAVPPEKDGTMEDIETLITHFLAVSWGPVIPAGEVWMPVEGTKGIQAYYTISDKDTIAYRTRIRTPSFAHVQIIPEISKGFMVPDLLAIIASTDFLLSEIDR